MSRPAHGRPKRRARPRTGRLVGWSVIVVCVLLLAAQAVASSSGEDTPARGARSGAPSPGTTGDRPPPLTPSPMAASPSASSPVTITSPGQRAQVAGKNGVRLTGTAGNLRHDELRFFVYAEDGRYYAAHSGPVRVTGGRWNLTIPRIGAGRRDVGSIFVIVATVADPSCRNALRAARADTAGNIAFTRLPSGCTERDSVSVRKTAP